MKHPILGRMVADPFSHALGIGYFEFASPSGISGLARESDDGRKIDILAVTALIERAGCFRSFMNECKDHYQVICIWQITNIWLPEVLKRYGFEPHEDFEKVPGGVERVSGMRWIKIANKPRRRAGKGKP